MKIRNANWESVYVGSKQLKIIDFENHISFPALVHYPTMEKSKPTAFGPFTMDVSPNGSILQGSYSLVIISHGNSGSHLLYRTISTFLAKKGYVVVMIEHFGNNRRNNELGNSIKNLVFRPLHVSLAIDYLIKDSFFGSHLDVEKISVIGHSFGGYTALCLAGGQPWTRSGEKVKVKQDPRINSIVLMAPAAGYFMPQNSLAYIHIPILLFIAECDRFTPKKWTSDVIMEGVPTKTKVILKEIKNAGHFSFLSPFPASMTNPGFLPSTDPEGFDRQTFHRQLPIEIYNFLND